VAWKPVGPFAMHGMTGMGGAGYDEGSYQVHRMEHVVTLTWISLDLFHPKRYWIFFLVSLYTLEN
jgi:hypothetical protein